METSDPSEKGSSDEVSGKKSCSDCRTTKTPLWRGGPEGPKSLCNACGIRYRKKRRAIMGINKVGRSEDHQKRKDSKSKLGVSMKMRLLALGEEVLLHRSAMEKKHRKLGSEEEQAAILLMALSCGSVYA
ncbi:hypothetical protein Sjap_006910 [Stephania japonica]|uniref:GATA-type domain-containing protein n=1 Tax=Stephania japonica TaxID=461633 RepID=A0AAP0PK71_9MAGN